MRQEILKQIEENIYITAEKIAQSLAMPQDEVKKELDALEEEFVVVKTRKEKYAMATTLGYFTGKIDIKQNGFGFLLLKDAEDIFIPAKHLGGAFNGETVLVKVDYMKAEGRLEGKVVKCLTPLPVSVTGTVHKNKKNVFVINDAGGEDIYIIKPAKKGVQSGNKVVVKVLKRRAGKKRAEGKISCVIGNLEEKGVDILVTAYKFGLKPVFDEKCIAEAEKISHEINIEGRVDLRDEITFTIDGDTAKDFDDAVSLKKLDNGNTLLGVHIADVAQYVTHNSELDKEAYARGTSVYLIDKVIPMLPEVLSNDLCSLNTGIDKLTLSCTMEFDANANLVGHDIFESVIRTCHRLTYKEVNRLYNNENLPHLDDVRQVLIDMDDLAGKLRVKRFERGSIDFELDEAAIELNDDGEVIDVYVVERGKSEKLIEEFMLKCNTTVAEHFNFMQIPFVYRIHEQPDKEKIQALSIFLSNFGIKLKGKITPKAIQKILLDVKDAPHASIVNNVTLRSLKKAKYATFPEEHFGLATEEYCHFTSPIRRYPDLQIHRIIKAVLRGKMTEKYISALEDSLDGVASHCSERERNAILAERTVNNMKMAQFMKNKVGEEYNGVVSGVANFGIFVELPNTIEGMVHLSGLEDDDYTYFEELYCVIGERTKRKIALGDAVKIKVVQVDLSSSKIEFAFAE